MKSLRVFVFLSLALLYVMTGNGQAPPFYFEQLSLSQGLSHPSVQDICRDSKGFMWFGTQDGLNRYDGYSMKIYRHRPGLEGSISDNSINAIIEDSRGYLWVGTETGGLNRYDPFSDTFTSFIHNPADTNSLSHNHVRSIIEGPNGNIWVGTFGGGLDRLNPESGTFSHFRSSPSDASTLSSNRIWNLFGDNQNRLWLALDNGRLDCFDMHTHVVTHYAHKPGDPASLSLSFEIWSVYEDHLGNIWVGTAEGGLDRLDVATGQFTHFRHNKFDEKTISSNSVWQVVQDHTGALWIGTWGGGLNRLASESLNADPESVAFTRYNRKVNPKFAFEDDSIWKLYQDQHGVLWIGTYSSGVFKLDPSRYHFNFYRHDPQDPHSISDDEVSHIIEGKDGYLWVATHNGGINRKDPETHDFRRFYHDPLIPSSLSHNRVMALAEDTHGYLWAGTRGGGLNRLDLSNLDKGFYHFLNGEEHGAQFPGKEIFSLVEDPERNVWVGSSTGLHKWVSQSEKFIHYPLSPASDTASAKEPVIRDIVQDSENPNILWLGTYKQGMIQFDVKTGSRRQYRHIPNDSTSIGARRVSFIHQDNSKRIWIGTFGGGLNLFDPEKQIFHRIDESWGLSGNYVNGFLEERPDRLWVSTSKGLSLLSTLEKGGNCLDQCKWNIRNFTHKDGLPFTLFELKAACISRDSLFYFGGSTGLMAFRPDSLVKQRVELSIVLTGFEIFSHDANLDSAIYSHRFLSLQQSDLPFSLEFAGMPVLNPLQNQYQYKLEGLNDEWFDLGPKNDVIFSHLSPGNYTFRVRLMSPGTPVQYAETHLHFEIVPPFWASWLFKFIASLMIIGIGYAVYSWRITFFKKQQTILKKEVDLRTTEIVRQQQALSEANQEIQTINNNLERLVEERTLRLAHAHKKLTESEAVLSLIYNSIDEYVALLKVETDQSLTIVSVNDKYVEARNEHGYNFEKEELIGLPLEEFLAHHMKLDSSQQSLRQENFQKMIETREPVTYEENRTLPNGDPLVWETTIIPIHNTKAELTHLLYVASDITAKKRMDEKILATILQTEDKARSRISKEIHDSLGQNLTTTSLNLDSIKKEIHLLNPKHQKRFHTALEFLHRAINESRNIAHNLMPKAIEDFGYILAVESIINGLKNIHPTRFSFYSNLGDQRLEPQLDLGLYRITQEAINNILRHSEAQNAIIQLMKYPDLVILTIEDDGIGLDMELLKREGENFGLQSMQNRAHSLSGTFEMDSRPGMGLVLTIQIPLQLQQTTTNEPYPNFNR